MLFLQDERLGKQHTRNRDKSQKEKHKLKKKMGNKDDERNKKHGMLFLWDLVTVIARQRSLPALFSGEGKVDSLLTHPLGSGTCIS